MEKEMLESLFRELQELRRMVSSQAGVARAALSLSETAVALSCSPRHVSRMVMRGELTPVDVGGLKRIPMSQINALLSAPPAPPTPKTPPARPERYSVQAELAKLRKR